MLSSHDSSHVPAEQQLDLVFRALGDRTRREILARLSHGSAKVTDLARPFAMSLPAVGKHLRVLEHAGLVQRTVNGRVHNCSLSALPLKSADQWLAHYQQFWGDTLEALATHLQDTEHDKTGGQE